MRRIICWMIASSMFAAANVGGGALADNPHQPPGARQADVHNPFSSRYLDFRPGGLARRRSAGTNTHGQGHIGGFNYYPNYYIRGYGGGSFYPPYYDRPYVYAPQTNIYNTNIFPPNQQPQPPARNLAVPGVVNRNELRTTNTRGRELGRRFIGFGDSQFSQGKYVDAQLRYRKAIKTAPDMAEAYFRRGQAMIALGRYDLAATSIKQGLQLKPTWALTQYRLDDIYGDAKDTKQEHLDALLREVDRQPLNADLEFLVAWQMYFGGQRAESRAHFDRAATLADEPSHLEGFLAATKSIDPVPPQDEQPKGDDAPDADHAPDEPRPDAEGLGIEI